MPPQKASKLGKCEDLVIQIFNAANYVHPESGERMPRARKHQKWWADFSVWFRRAVKQDAKGEQMLSEKSAFVMLHEIDVLIEQRLKDARARVPNPTKL